MIINEAMLRFTLGIGMIGEVKCCNERCGKIFLGTARAKYCSKRCQSAYLRAQKSARVEDDKAINHGNMGRANPKGS